MKNFMYYKTQMNLHEEKKQVLKLYKEFIIRYGKLNQTFGYEDPVQIYTMFTYLLRKGFLSKNKEYAFAKNKVVDEIPLLGSNVLMGQGVCRHTSFMLNDILKESDLPSAIMCVKNKLLSSIVDVSFEKSDSSSFSKEQLYNLINEHVSDYETILGFYHEVDDLISQNTPTKITFDIKLSFEENDNLKPDHVINLAIKDNKSYFLDPTNFRMYRIDYLDKARLYDIHHNQIYISETSMNQYFNNKAAMKTIDKGLTLTNISREEEVEKAIMTLDDCYQNVDVFAHFYHDNFHLYDEVAVRLNKIRKYRKVNKVN